MPLVYSPPLSPDPVLDPPDTRCFDNPNNLDYAVHHSHFYKHAEIILSSIILTRAPPVFHPLPPGSSYPGSIRDMGNCISFQYVSLSHLDAIIASFKEYGDISNCWIRFTYNPTREISYFVVSDVTCVQKDVLITKYQFINLHSF